MRVYLLSSFPTLSPHAPVPFPYETFFRRCADHLPENELEEIDAVCATPPGGKSDFAKAWADAWTTLDQINRRERLQRLPRDAADTLPPRPTSHDQLRAEALDAWSASTPLERETALLTAQWSWIDAHRRPAPYSLADLLGYGLQLRLLERRDSWDETQGAAQFNEHADSFLDPLIDKLRTTELSA